MTHEEKEKILSLNAQGWGAKKIAKVVGIPLNSIKSFLYRADTERTKAAEDGVCLYCQKPLEQPPHNRQKRFCNAACRMRWWNEHQHLVKRNAFYDFTCPHCGKKFTAYGNDHRVYCSRKCHADARRKNGKLPEHFNV